MSQDKPSSDAELRQLLGAGHAATPADKAKRAAPASQASKPAELRDLLRSGGLDAPPPANSAPSKATAKPAAKADQALHEALRAAPPAPDADETGSDPANSPWVARIAWSLMVLVLTGSGYWWSRQTPEGIPGTLQTLAQSVNQYHQKNGKLPEQLSNLDGFPKEAVEWPLHHWNARDARGRTEILWAPNGQKHYRIVLRQGKETWIYSDKEGKSRQTNK